MKPDVFILFFPVHSFIRKKPPPKRRQSGFRQRPVHPVIILQPGAGCCSSGKSTPTGQKLSAFHEEIQPNGSYLMSGNRISVKTLDLNCEFERIADQLDEIVNNIFWKAVRKEVCPQKEELRKSEISKSEYRLLIKQKITWISIKTWL